MPVPGAGGRRQIDEARKAVERIVRDGHRAGDIIKTIRALARKSRPEMTQLFADGMENSSGNDFANPEHLRKVAARLRDYARQLVNIVKPENPE